MTKYTPTDKQMAEAWEFVRLMREEWTEEDWADFYHGISFAFFKIRRRHASHRPAKAIDYQI